MMKHFEGCNGLQAGMGKGVTDKKPGNGYRWSCRWTISGNVPWRVAFAAAGVRCPRAGHKHYWTGRAREAYPPLCL